MKKPDNFDGSKFAQKYGLNTLKSFWDDGKGNIICPSLPDLTDSDLLDCVADVLLKLSPSQQIILADGVDVAWVTINGEAGATVEYTVNGEPFSETLNESGSDTIELTCDTPNTTMLVQAGTARAVIYAVEVPS